MFDSKLDWKAHIQQLKSKCNKALNLMRSVSSTEWGADQKTLMMIYRSLIRSKLDCGCIVFISVNSRDLESIESVSNEAMRVASGCFKSTPVSSLQVITEEPPLQIRRDKLSLKYYYKVKTLPQHPVFKFISPEKNPICKQKFSPSVRNQKKIHTKLNFENKGVQPDFSYVRLGIKEPRWGLSSTRIHLPLTDLQKKRHQLRLTRRDLNKLLRINAKD